MASVSQGSDSHARRRSASSSLYEGDVMSQCDSLWILQPWRRIEDIMRCIGWTLMAWPWLAVGGYFNIGLYQRLLSFASNSSQIKALSIVQRERLSEEMRGSGLQPSDTDRLVTESLGHVSALGTPGVMSRSQLIQSRNITTNTRLPPSLPPRSTSSLCWLG